MKYWAGFLLCALLFGLPAAVLSESRQEAHQIDASRSSLTVYVYKSGLFAFAADNHTISAPIGSGELDAPLTAVELSVPTAKMLVLDPQMPAGRRAQVQERMVGPDVLDTAKFPSIDFKSTSITGSASAGWDIAGKLTIHGTTKAIKLHVTQADGHYRGSTMVRQTDFGIQPIRIAGGTVKVKDDIKVEFDIVTR